MSNTKRKLLRKINREKKDMEKYEKQPGKTDELPFIIHGSPRDDIPQYTTHIHGLNEIGMPEFIMDPLAFGLEGNAGVINAAYRYFSRPENKGRMDEILHGKTVKLREKEFRPKSKGDDVFCFREVSPDFEAVKLAYPAGDNLGYNIKDAKIIQIYVEGDNHVLNDDYYRDGVLW